MNFTTKWFANNPVAHQLSFGSRKPTRARPFFAIGLIFAAGLLAYALTGSLVLLIAILIAGCLALAWILGIEASTGIFLLALPLQWLAIALLQLNGVAQYREISAIKEVLLASAVLWFIARTRLEIILPDILLGTALLLVLFEQIFHPDLQGMRDDWEWALAYLLGRVLILSPQTQIAWARCAVWMCAVLAVAGAWEVEFLGSAPRLLLLRATEGETRLPAAFTATGYAGFRAASTMVSPLSFSALCMVGLILWWTYLKNPLPAVLIGAGLALTLTRSAVAATILGVLVIALRRGERARVAFFAIVLFIGLVIAVSTLNLQRYVESTFTSGADTSTIGHRTSVVQGFDAMIQHPLGIGAGTVGPHALTSNEHALQIEDSYLVIAVEYSAVVGLIFVSFIVSCLWFLYRQPTPIAYAALSILLGYGFLLSVGPLHLDIPLACWVWVPVGMGIRSFSGLSQARIARL